MASPSNERQRTWIVRLLRQRASAPLVGHPAAPDDPLSAFAAEGDGPRSAPLATTPVQQPGNQRIGWLLGVGVTTAVVASMVAFTQMRAVATRTPNPEWGKLTVDSRPVGVAVAVDGEHRGVTPLTLSLKPGQHAMTLRSGTEQKSVPLSILSGVEQAQYFEFAVPVAPALVGKLSVSSDPPAARIQIDGKSRGSAPILVSDLEPGEHTVSAAGETGTVERKVTIEAGMVASLAFSLPKTAGPAAGWVAVSAPFDVQIYENNDLVGTGATAKIMLPAGRHDVRVVSQALAYEDTRRVDVAAGKVSGFKIDPPKVTISANAKPWADVTIDDVSVGQTPLSNVSIAIGTHQVVFRHPQLGEQRQTVVVTAKGPNRISADMTKK